MNLKNTIQIFEKLGLKGINIMRFHLYEVTEKVKLIYDEEKIWMVASRAKDRH